ncbi:Xyloglucan glycosyltransferase 4 [Geodia barretti]|uniref:Glucomannan synthase n=1 Tax=Geodia barretti TaxID=519541 RepID=A0AA35RAE0_GEOBA|nr:Xyloglucan glycosyltransferase 4 [Geodia barretti]
MRGAPLLEREPPAVLIQLPVFNERYVVERLIRAVAALDYPRSRLSVQVLDDSTDDTGTIADRVVAECAAAGLDICRIHRTDRRGFKAGALQVGLDASDAPFVVIFDADFVPKPDFLQEALPYLLGDERTGLVQARWDHLNRDYSLLTDVQAILLDGHFMTEHGGRHVSGCFFNFNGTAGIWRRAAIEDAGGWEGDTLTEDLDLSYRAQLRGWRFVFVPEIAAPAELPVSMNAFKAQQRRWAQGSLQTARKLLPQILASPLPLRVRAEAFFHLSSNLAYPLMAVLSLLMAPVLFARVSTGLREMALLDIPIFAAATLSVVSFYSFSQSACSGSSRWASGRGSGAGCGEFPWRSPWASASRSATRPRCLPAWWAGRPLSSGRPSTALPRQVTRQVTTGAASPTGCPPAPSRRWSSVWDS